MIAIVGQIGSLYSIVNKISMKKIIYAIAIFALLSLSACKGSCPKFSIPVPAIAISF